MLAILLRNRTRPLDSPSLERLPDAPTGIRRANRSHARRLRVFRPSVPEVLVVRGTLPLPSEGDLLALRWRRALRVYGLLETIR